MQTWRQMQRNEYSYDMGCQKCGGHMRADDFRYKIMAIEIYAGEEMPVPEIFFICDDCYEKFVPEDMK